MPYLDMKKRRTPSRITRSISFEADLMVYCKKKAAKLRRTVNWVVNDLVRAELESAAPQ